MAPSSTDPSLNFQIPVKETHQSLGGWSLCKLPPFEVPGKKKLGMQVASKK